MNEQLDHYWNNARIKLLAGFSDEDRGALLSCGAVRTYRLHDRIVTEGDNDLNLFILLDGQASVWQKDARVLDLSRGESYNETVVFLPRPAVHTVVAESEVVVLRLNRKDILRYFGTRPERLMKIFVLNVIATLTVKMSSYENRLVEQYYQALTIPGEE